MPKPEIKIILYLRCKTFKLLFSTNTYKCKSKLAEVNESHNKRHKLSLSCTWEVVNIELTQQITRCCWSHQVMRQCSLPADVLNRKVKSIEGYANERRKDPAFLKAQFNQSFTRSLIESTHIDQKTQLNSFWETTVNSPKGGYYYYRYDVIFYVRSSVDRAAWVKTIRA